MSLRLSSSFHLFLLVVFLLIKVSNFEKLRESREVSSFIGYPMKPLEKSLKGKIDIKTLMPKIPKHIQVYIAVAFSERDFPAYSKMFNKTLSSIPNSFLILDSMNRHYNISISPLFFVLPNSGRFSSSIYEVMCNSFNKKRVAAILVIGESPAAFTVSLASVTSNIPVLWARGGTPNPPGSLLQQNPLEIRLEPGDVQLLEAVRGIFLATHWHSFTVMAAPSLAARCASILDFPPLNPKVVAITRNSHNIFRKLADVSRSTRGVVLLLCDLSDAFLVMDVAKKLNMIDGHFVWIWIDTTNKPASFLTVSTSSTQNLTQKFTRYLDKTFDTKNKKNNLFYQNDSPSFSLNLRTQRKTRSDAFKIGKREGDAQVKPMKLSLDIRKRFENQSEKIDDMAISRNGSEVPKEEYDNYDLRDDNKTSKFSILTDTQKYNSVEHLMINKKIKSSIFKKNNSEVEKLPNKVFKASCNKKNEKEAKKWEEFAPMDYVNDFAVQLDYPSEKKEIEDEEEFQTSKVWGKITEHFPGGTSTRRDEKGKDLQDTNLPIGLLSVKPEPLKLDRHLVKGSVRLLVSSFHSVLKKSADWLNILDSDSSCWTKPSLMNRNFSEMYAKEIRQAVKEVLSGQLQFQDGDRADRSLVANFQILNLVPEKFNINFYDDVNVIEEAILYWRQVGKVLGRSAHLNTIVWPGGDLVASALSARTRSVFRVVTALAPPFVMEGALDEDGQCLRGVICHRVMNSDKDNLTLVFNEMDTQERMEDEVEELGGDERTEKPFKFFDQNYFEFHSTKYKYKSSCCYGLAMDLLENIAQELEFEFHLYITPDGAYGAKNHVWEKGVPRSKWNGIVGDLVSGAAHMSFAALSVSKQRSQVIDFSTPYFFSGVSFLAAPTQKSEVPLLAFLLPFSTELWIAIFTSLNITAMAVACYEWLSPFGLNPWGRQRSRNFSIASALWVMWGLLCGHLVAFKAPKSWPNKFLINVWGGFSVIFVASYTANIAALIAGLFFHNSVSDYRDRSLLSQRVGAPKSSSVDYYIHRANQHLWEHMQKYSFKDVETGIALLRNGSLDILIADTPILDYYRATDHGCKLQKIVDAINEDTYAIGMNKGFPLKESISAVISKYSNNGYMDILTEKWYGGLPCFKMTPSVELTDVGQPRPLGVAAVAGVFLLLGLGMVIGVLILILEHLFYRYTLPVLRHQPKGTIWRSRNIMFFSQKLYRFINCVELVSPHHAARELVHTLRQGQITSLFQKSVIREHEQRRRRKSKAQFFEMIQEIRRVQQEEKEEPKQLQKVVEGVESSPKVQLRGFLTSPRSLKHFCSSKSSVSPQLSVDLVEPLNPSELLQHRRPSKSPSRLDIRRFSKELFSLPRSPKSPKTKSSSSLEGRRLSSDIEENKSKGELKTCRTSDIRLSAKDIRIQTSNAIGRRLSKDASSWLTTSPPDLNSRRKSHLDITQTKPLSASENLLGDTPKSITDLNSTSGLRLDQLKYNEYGRDNLSKSLTLTPVISKAATIRLASSGSLDAPKSVKNRPRLPSPPKSPVIEFRNVKPPKISISNADNLNIYETIIPKNELNSLQKPTKSSHGRSKSLDNKHLNFAATLFDIESTDDKDNRIRKQTVSYATLDHKKNNLEDDNSRAKNTVGDLATQKSANILKERQISAEGRRELNKNFPLTPFDSHKTSGKDSKILEGKFEVKSNSPHKVNQVKSNEAQSIYAEPQKLKKEKKDEKPSAHKTTIGTSFFEPPPVQGKPKITPKNNALKHKQVRAYSAPETGSKSSSTTVVFMSEEPYKKQTFPEYNYYSEHKKFKKSDSFPEKRAEIRCGQRCFDTFPIDRSCSEFHRPSGSKLDRKCETTTRSKSVPEQRCLVTSDERKKRKTEAPLIIVQHFSKSLDAPSRNPGILKNRRSRSRDEVDLTPAPPSPSRVFSKYHDRSSLSNVEVLTLKKKSMDPP